MPPDLPENDSSPSTHPARKHRSLWRTLVLTLVSLAVMASTGGAVWVDRYVNAVPQAAIPDVDLIGAFFDTRPITVTTTLAWTTVREIVETERLRFDHTLWRRMFFRDWDQLPEAVRDRGVSAMLRRYSDLLAARTAGRQLSAEAWDTVPQPIRAMAFVNMIEHWAETEPPAAGLNLDQMAVLRTLKAICMTESWFEHRAINTNGDGSTDLGLPQASDYARQVTRRWTEAGLWSMPMRNDDYFNPWLATRWLVAWFGLMLKESGGDLELAVRAYNVGRPRARREGAEYLSVVLARRERYFEGPSGSPTWQLLSTFRHDALAGTISQAPAAVDGTEPGP